MRLRKLNSIPIVNGDLRSAAQSLLVPTVALLASDSDFASTSDVNPRAEVLTSAVGWLPNDLESMNCSYRFLLSLAAASKRPDFPALPPPIVRILEEVETFD